jgi:hypothetical protein
MTAIVEKVTKVEPHGENLSIVTTSSGHQVIANKDDDGNFRWTEGEILIYVSEGSILPEDVLKDRGYWDFSENKNRGLLDGGKRNRVKMKKLAGFESRGLLFKVSTDEIWSSSESDDDTPFHAHVTRGDKLLHVRLGDDVSAFFDIEEFKG